jgi:DNA-binding PadR family transcriptional regulator
MAKSQPQYPGQFEQMVLLAILRLGPDAVALEIRDELERQARRRVSRGALYRTLERMREKGYVSWTIGGEVGRGGHQRRLFRVSKRGLSALRDSRETLLNLWDGVEPLLEASS